MSDWIGIKKSINSTLGTPDDKPLNELLDNDIAELNKALSTLLKGGNVPIVKSVQRGVTNLPSGNSNITITIESVNVDKSIILVEGSGYRQNSVSSLSSGYVYASVPLYISSFQSNLFVISRPTSSDSTKVSWQVVEFY